MQLCFTSPRCGSLPSFMILFARVLNSLGQWHYKSPWVSNVHLPLYVLVLWLSVLVNHRSSQTLQVLETCSITLRAKNPTHSSLGCTRLISSCGSGTKGAGTELICNTFALLAEDRRLGPGSCCARFCTQIHMPWKSSFCLLGVFLLFICVLSEVNCWGNYTARTT